MSTATLGDRAQPPTFPPVCIDTGDRKDPCRECPVRSKLLRHIDDVNKANEAPTYLARPTGAMMAAVAMGMGGEIYLPATPGMSVEEADGLLITTYASDCTGPAVEKKFSLKMPLIARITWGKLVLRCQNPQLPAYLRREFFGEIQRS